jgi:putative DNA primase/helicase
MTPFSKDDGENALAKLIVRELGGRWFGDHGMARCPAHHDKNPSLSIKQKNGILLVYCHAGCSQRDVIRALASRGLWPGQGQLDSKVDLSNEEVRDRERVARIAQQIWDCSVPAGGTLVERYLRNRDIEILSSALRFHPSLRHPSGGNYPAMVALVTNGITGLPAAAIHRTFLALDGTDKAPVSKPKLALAHCRGGVIRLASASGLVMIAEGIETALSVMQATKRPAWAALSTSFLRSLELPPEITEVIVLADGDDPGEAAARHAALSWRRQGRHVRIARPPRGSDFNDVLCGR